MKKYVYAVTSHVEVEKNNWSSEVVKAFTTFDKAHDFAGILKSQAEDNETIEIDELDLE